MKEFGKNKHRSTPWSRISIIKVDHLSA